MLKPKDLLESLEKVIYSDEMLEPEKIKQGSRPGNEIHVNREGFIQRRMHQQMQMLSQYNAANDLNQYQYASSVALPNFGLHYNNRIGG